MEGIVHNDSLRMLIGDRRCVFGSSYKCSECLVLKTILKKYSHVVNSGVVLRIVLSSTVHEVSIYHAELFSLGIH